MIKIHKNSRHGLLLLAVLLLASSWQAGAQHMPVSHSMPPETEAQLIQDLDPSHSERVITHTLGQLEDRFSTSTNSVAAMKALLTDSREPVRIKAARVLGIFHAQMDPDSLRQICKMLKSDDWHEVQGALKALRGLAAPQSVPDILPCLQHANPYVVRDACRTLAVLGDKSVVAAIKPLTESPNPDVKKDASDAIFKLSMKP